MNLAMTVVESPMLAAPLLSEVSELGRTVQGYHADDKPNGKHHDNKGVDLETRRLVRIQS